MASTRQLAELRFSIIGAGRVGASLAHWIVSSGGTLETVAARPGSPGSPILASAETLTSELGGALAEVIELASAGQDLLLLAVPDGALVEVVESLAGRPQAQVVLHTSGGRGAAVLASLRARGSAIGTFHPLRAFAGRETDLERAAGVVFTLDGDPAAQALGRRLAAAFRGLPCVVPEEARALYHLAATLAAGGMVTLLAAAWELSRALDLPDAVRQGYLALSRQALAEAERLPHPAAAITGPFARGESATVSRALHALAGQEPALLPLVAALGRESLRQRAGLAPWSPEQQILARELAESASPLSPKP